MLSPNPLSPPPIENTGHVPERTAAEMPRRSFGLDSLARHRWIVIAGAIVGLLAGLTSVATRKAVYTAWMELLVYNRQIATGPATVVLPGRVDVPLVQNQNEVLRSRLVLGKVIDTLDLTKDPEFFSRSKGLLTSLKELIFPPPPQLVDDRTFAFVETLTALRRNIDVTRVGASHMVRLDVRSTDPRKAVRIANEIARTYLQERRAHGMGGDAQAIRELYQGLGPSAYVVSDVQPPIRRNGLPGYVIVLGAGLFGLGLGAFGAVLRDVLSNKIRNPEQLEYFLGLPCLAVVRASSSGGRERIATLLADLGSVSGLLRDRNVVRSLGVTSVAPADGVTTIALNLARSIGRSGSNVLVIDCHPDESRSPAKQDARVAGAKLAEVEGVDRCSVQLYALDSLIRLSSGLYDFVIVDLPPLATSADARVAARALDGLLLVVRWDEVDCRLASQALDSSVEARTKFVGAVLNMADARTARMFGGQPLLYSRELTAPNRVRPRDEFLNAGRLSEEV